MSSIKNRLQQLEQNNKVSVLGQKIHFAATHEGQDALNAEVLNDVAVKESRGQRCILFTVMPPKPRQ